MSREDWKPDIKSGFHISAENQTSHDFLLFFVQATKLSGQRTHLSLRSTRYFRARECFPSRLRRENAGKSRLTRETNTVNFVIFFQTDSVSRRKTKSRLSAGAAGEGAAAAQLQRPQTLSERAMAARGGAR